MLRGGQPAADERHGAPPPDTGLDVLDVLVSDAEAHTPTRTIEVIPTRFGPAHITTDAIRTSAAIQESRPRWMRRYQKLLVGVDLVAASLAVAIAFLVRFGIPADSVNVETYAVLAVAIPVAWVGVVWLNRAYEGRFIGAGPAEFDRLLKAFLYLTALVAIGSYLTRADIARGFVVLALPLALVIDLVARHRARKYLHRQRSRGRAMTSMLLVGDGRSVADFAAVLRRDRYAGMNVAGACVPAELADDAETCRQLADADVPLLGGLDSIVSAVRASRADTVAVVSTSTVGRDRLRWISWQLEGTDTDLVVSPGLTEVAGRRLHIQPVAGLPLLHVEEPEFTGFRRVVKNAFDGTVATAALLILLPIALSVSVAVRISSRGPVFFRQQRIGRYGEPFTMVKFRSMYVDAEARQAELDAQNVNSDGLLFKVRNDPRVTPVGRFIRKYSLDELPQLFNVLSGRMSLVGPRPPLPAEVAKYGDDVRRRLLVKPGITGLWQISGRSDLSWQETVQLDLRYVENWTLGYDLMILWKTPSAVARGSGAY
jgi:exopolysaccharide biosynthesis polyprenyl glycosylphosphotransferase